MRTPDPSMGSSVRPAVRVSRPGGDAGRAARAPTPAASPDGQCRRSAELCNLTRFLTYHDHHGHRAEARRLDAELDHVARDWHGADLEAARRACPNQLDFARLLPRAEGVLG